MRRRDAGRAAGWIAGGAVVWAGGCAGLAPDPRSPDAPSGWDARRQTVGESAAATDRAVEGGGVRSGARRGGGPVPVQMVLSRGTATDSDANGYPDTVPVIAYLFPGQGDGALPVLAEGTFRFTLRGASGAEAAVWEFPSEVAAASARELGPGPGYSFFLRLADGQDVMAAQTFELIGEFWMGGAGAAAARSGGGASVRLGAGSRSVPIGGRRDIEAAGGGDGGGG